MEIIKDNYKLETDNTSRQIAKLLEILFTKSVLWVKLTKILNKNTYVHTFKTIVRFLDVLLCQFFYPHCSEARAGWAQVQSLDRDSLLWSASLPRRLKEINLWGTLKTGTWDIFHLIFHPINVDTNANQIWGAYQFLDEIYLNK